MKDASHQNFLDVVDVHVAVIDDNESILDAAKLWLSEHFEVSTHLCAEDFLLHFKSQVAMPTCLILESDLPGKSGTELLNHLHQVGHFIPTIFLTAHPIDKLSHLFPGHAVQQLLKPLDGHVLLKAIRQSLV